MPIDHTQPRYTPREKSRTSRNELKGRIRNQLGAIGDGAPSTYRTLLAAQNLSEMIYLASGDRLKLQLIDTHTDRPVDWRNALAEADRSDAS
jgi:hypothetical protein